MFGLVSKKKYMVKIFQCEELKKSLKEEMENRYKAVGELNEKIRELSTLAEDLRNALKEVKQENETLRSKLSRKPKKKTDAQ